MNIYRRYVLRDLGDNEGLSTGRQDINNIKLPDNTVLIEDLKENLLSLFDVKEANEGVEDHTKKARVMVVTIHPDSPCILTRT